MGLHVETGEHVIHFVFEGATPARDIYATFHRAFGEATPDHQLVIDLRASTSLADRTPEFVRMLTEFVLEHPERPGERVAVVLPPGEVPRWEDLTRTFTEHEGLDIALFEEREAAETWATD